MMTADAIDAFRLFAAEYFHRERIAVSCKVNR